MKKEFGIGILFVIIAVFFGFYSLQLDIGDTEKIGPGLIPLTVSAVLLTVGVISIIIGHYLDSAPVALPVKNITFVLLSLTAFAVLTTYVGIVAGTIVLVAIASLASERSSFYNIMPTAVVLIAILYALKYFLKMPLPL
jgi:hypothetical protein